MRFLLTFHMRSDQMPNASENDKGFSAMMEFVAELKRHDVLVFDSQILPNPPPVRFEKDRRIDGESAEILGGFFIIRVENRKQAVEIAERCPHREVGAVGRHTLNETEENAYQPVA